MEQLVHRVLANGLAGPGGVALRCLRVAAGGALAQSEMTRMITEKVEALGEAQTAAAIGAVSGRSGRQIAKKVAGVYKKRVRGNRRRLTR